MFGHSIAEDVVEKDDIAADIQQLTSLINNTFYSEEFNCQELISNASDVPDEICYESITGPEKIEAQSNFFFKIISDNQFHHHH